VQSRSELRLTPFARLPGAREMLRRHWSELGGMLYVVERIDCFI
jgi:hypothetical protein